MTLRLFDESRDGEALRTWLANAESARWLAPAHEDASGKEVAATRWTLLRDGAPAGYGELLLAPDGTHVRLRRVVVDPGKRRNGLGSELVRALVEQSRGLYPDIPLYARIDPGNLPALLAYPAAGLVPLEPLPQGFDEEGVWLAALTEEPAIPGGPIDT